MSEKPHPHPEGENKGLEKKTYLNLVPRMVKATHKKCVEVITHPITIGAAVGTLAMPGYGTVIGAALGPSMVKLIPSQDTHDHGGH